MLGKLSSLGLVVRVRCHDAALTPVEGRAALEMVRGHRVLKMYLTRSRRYRWDQVHHEAEQLEHFISDRLESRMYEALARAQEDPHSDLIPTAKGSVARTEYRRLIACEVGGQITSRRVPDLEADNLCALPETDLELGACIQVLDQSLYEGPIAIPLPKRRVEVPNGLARVVYLA